MEMWMPRAPKMTPTKMASDSQIPYHNLEHVCCAKFRLFLIFPSPGRNPRPSAAANGTRSPMSAQFC